MPNSLMPHQSAQSSPDLEQTLLAVELRLAALGEALRARDAAAIDCHAGALHHALASAVDHFSQAARNGGVPATLRRRLVSASGQVAAQRESLSRATAALDRAIDVLLPRDLATLYSPLGGPARAVRGGMIQV